MIEKEHRLEAVKKVVEIDQNNEAALAASTNDAQELNQNCNSLTVGTVRPVSSGEAKLLTLLQAYDAKLVDVPIAELVSPLYKDTATPVLEGEVVLFTEMLQQRHQLKPITVRQLEADKYELLEGDAQIIALMDLGYTHTSAIVITCEDDEVAIEVRGILQQTNHKIPYKVCLNAFGSVKQAIQQKRKELKADGKKDLPTTNAMLAEVLGTSETYAKQLEKLASRDDKEQLAEDLDNGSNINAVSKGLTGNGRIKGIKPQESACTVDVPEGFDLSAFCSECPKLQKFQEQLKAKRELLTKTQ